MKPLLVQTTVKQMSLVSGTIMDNDQRKDNKLIEEPFDPMLDWIGSWNLMKQIPVLQAWKEKMSDEPCPGCSARLTSPHGQLSAIRNVSELKKKHHYIAWKK